MASKVGVVKAERDGDWRHGQEHELISRCIPVKQNDAMNVVVPS